MRVSGQKFASVFDAFLIIVAIIVVSENDISFNSIMYKNNPEIKPAMLCEWRNKEFDNLTCKLSSSIFQTP